MRVRASSAGPTKDRWTELELESDLRAGETFYLLTVSGCSRLPGETTRTRVSRLPDAAAVITELRHATNGWSMLATELLDRAAEVDARIAAAWQH